jgi:hypothetical protein
MRPCSRSLMGFGPKIPKASCNTRRNTAQKTILPMMSEGSTLLRSNAGLREPRSMRRSNPP